MTLGTVITKIPAPNKDTLSTRKTLDLIQLAQAGDRRAEDTLIRHSSPRILRILYRFDCAPHALEDLYQEGAIAIRQAIHTYRPDKGMSWPSYSYRAAHCKMVTAVKARNNRPAAHETLTDHHSYIADRNAEHPGDTQFGLCGYTYVHEHLRLLAPRETHVISSYYGLDRETRSLRDLAEEMGLTCQRAQQIKTEALDKLYKSMNGATSTEPPAFQGKRTAGPTRTDSPSRTRQITTGHASRCQPPWISQPYPRIEAA